MFRAFNRGFDSMRNAYGRALRRTVRRPGLAIAVFAAMLALTGVGFFLAPTGFIPQQDQGYLITIVELPKGSSLERTTEVVQRATQIALKTPGVERVVAFAGLSVVTNSNASHSGTVFAGLKDFDDRSRGESGPEIAAKLNAAFSEIQEASLFVVAPPPVRGIGSGGDFKLMVQDRSGQGLNALESSAWKLVGALGKSGEVARPFSTFTTTSPRYFLDIDRTKAEMMDVPVENVFDTLQVYLGSSYVNDFTLFGRNYRVTAQADAPYRLAPEDVGRLRTRNASGEMVPLGSLVRCKPSSGPDRVVRHNLYPAAEVQVGTLPGTSSGQTMANATRLADETLPPGIGFQWTELAYQQTKSSDVGLLVFPLSVLFVFLVLTAQYESWTLPLAIVLIVPLCLLFAIAALLLRGLDINILAQIGFVVLIGLASKNAILIVEFARQQEHEGKDRFTARHGCRAAPAPADPDDLVCIHRGRRAAHGRVGRRRRDAPGAGYRGLRRHARGDRDRPVPDAGVLHGDQGLGGQLGTLYRVTPVSPGRRGWSSPRHGHVCSGPANRHQLCRVQAKLRCKG